MTDYRDEAPQVLCDFLSYHENIKAHSQKTVDEYFLDLRNFFRYIKQSRDRSLRDLDWDEISIMDVDVSLIRSITLTDVYGYLTYLSRDRAQQPNSDKTKYGLTASTRARKIATLRSFFNYLTRKAHLLEENPIKDLDSPKLKKTLPKYLTLDESLELLESVTGTNQERDYCILTIFLNCGLRISERTGYLGHPGRRPAGAWQRKQGTYRLPQRCLQGGAGTLSGSPPSHRRTGSERPVPLQPGPADQPL